MQYSTATNYILWSNFTGHGMKPDPKKIQALQDLPTPENHKQLQTFLDLINHLQPILPNFCFQDHNFKRKKIFFGTAILQMQHSRNLNNGYVIPYLKQQLYIMTTQSL